jgi:octanoyl-[GcvH]:protein N-octanoyltransferase
MTIFSHLPAGIEMLDRSMFTNERDILYPFALEELLCRKIGKGAAPIIHLWRHPRAFVIGLRDSRLPQALEAELWLNEQGYTTAVRNSGGAAVPLDLGVLNVSLLLPKAASDIDTRKDFERLTALIQEAIQKQTNQIKRGEVAGSFCPGEFDLSIGGRKFCGIAQRRQQHAFSVQAFVIVEGAGDDKAEEVKAFYERAAVGAKLCEYPIVEMGSMASLSECVGMPISNEQFVSSLHEVLNAHGKLNIPPNEVLPKEEEIKEMIEILRQRYKIKGGLVLNHNRITLRN